MAASAHRGKSGYLPEQHIFGHKTVAFMEANVQKGLPDLVGLIAVFSSETGMPLGLVDGSSVTGMRTGAAGAIGAKYLARKNFQNALIVGTGNQAPFQIAALLKVFPTLETIRIANPHNAGHAAAFASKIRAMLQTDFAIEAASVTFEGVSDLQEAVSDSDIIITITPSHTPRSIRKAASKCAFSAGGMEYCIGIVTTTDYSKNEFEKFQLRGSDNLFDDFLLY